MQARCSGTRSKVTTSSQQTGALVLLDRNQYIRQLRMVFRLWAPLHLRNGLMAPMLQGASDK